MPLLTNDEKSLAAIRKKKAFICDMDGVIYHGNRLIPGVSAFMSFLEEENKDFLFLTNASQRSPAELQQKLARMGLSVGEEHFYTSALATAMFLESQSPGASAYVIGDPGLVKALYDVGITMNDYNPDYVVFGETSHLSYEMLEHAVLLVQKGAKLIGTNTDLTAPTEKGIIPACRALIAPVERATGKQAYFVGKPNPLMMRHALRKLGYPVEDVAIIGDRMDTDIVAGVESEIDTVLVLSGVSTEETVRSFPYRPKYILNHVGEIAGLL